MNTNSIQIRPRIWWRIIFPTVFLGLCLLALRTDEMVAWIVAGAFLVQFIGPLSGLVQIKGNVLERHFAFGILRDSVQLSKLNVVEIAREEHGRKYPLVLKLEDDDQGRLVLELWFWERNSVLFREIVRHVDVTDIVASARVKRRFAHLATEADH